ncbi:MAG: hypothetical protein ABWK01_09060 [Infirmifilum sp.]
MRFSTLLTIVAWGVLLVAIGLGVIKGYEVLPSVILVFGLTIMFKALSIPCQKEKCPSRGFWLLWAVIFLEIGGLIELYKFYSSPPLIIGLLLIILGIIGFIIDKRYSIF